MFSKFNARYATPLITGLFLVSLISGIALFFHVGQATFHSMHEWLSMVLVLPFVLHLVRNWRPFLSYLKRGWMVLPVAASLVAALFFAVPELTGSTTTAGPGGNPVMALASAVANGKIADVAPLMKKSPDEVSGLLVKAGYTVAPDQTIAEIAQASGKRGSDAVMTIVTAR